MLIKYIILFGSSFAEALLGYHGVGGTTLGLCLCFPSGSEELFKQHYEFKKKLQQQQCCLAVSVIFCITRSI